MRIETISPSSYSVYTWCQWKWFLQYCLKFKDPAGPSALVGTIAHDVLEQLSVYKMEKKEPSDIGVLWQKCQEVHFSKDPENAAKLQPAKIKAVKIGLDWLLSTKYHPSLCDTISAEYKFEIEMTNPFWVIGRNKDGSPQYFKFIGKIDRTDQIDEHTIEVVDYKSGGLKHWPPGYKDGDKTLEDFYDDIQCLMYYYATKKKYPKAKSVLVTFIYFVAKEIFTVVLTDNDVDKIEKVLKQRFYEIKENNTPEQNRGWWCNKICQFGKDGTCSKVWAEKEQMGSDFVEDYYQTRNMIQRDSNV